ncbi:MAG: 30S ribosomal protein S20 [Treponema sp.]|nr:30S ribosomal protein S20 [Treponema sp.]
MAKKKDSAEKRHRQSEERRLRNKSVKSAVRTSVKKFVVLAQKTGRASANPAEDVAETETALRNMIKKLDTAAQKGIIKKNTAARKKSRMQKLFNSLRSAQ